jgi:hypothetical protein
MSMQTFRSCAILLLLGTLAAGCRDRASGPSGRPEQGPSSSTPGADTSTLLDLTGSLDAIRISFNAHKHENRFLTLLSPT